MRARLSALAALGAVSLLALPAWAQEPAPEPVSSIPEVPASRAEAGPIPVGYESDVYCSGWIGGVDEKFPGRIISAEKLETRASYMQGDIMYLDIGSSRGVVPGQEFWVVRPGRIVYEPGSVTKEVGRLYETPARLKVVCVQEETSIAEITASCSDSTIGDLVLPFEPIPIPLARVAPLPTSCDSSSGKIQGRIVEVFDTATPVATDTVVYLDLGDKDGLLPGDFLTVFRPRDDVNTLRTILGQVAILSTREHTSVAKVVSMTDTMYVGDSVELR